MHFYDNERCLRSMRPEPVLIIIHSTLEQQARPFAERSFFSYKTYGNCTFHILFSFLSSPPWSEMVKAALDINYYYFNMQPRVIVIFFNARRKRVSFYWTFPGCSRFFSLLLLKTARMRFHFNPSQDGKKLRSRSCFFQDVDGCMSVSFHWRSTNNWSNKTESCEKFSFIA